MADSANPESMIRAELLVNGGKVELNDFVQSFIGQAPRHDHRCGQWSGLLRQDQPLGRDDVDYDRFQADIAVKF